ncbi:MAG: phage tail protein [Lentisphaeria bacterium]|nr:phage tail protein [Lentisphaeria bacterium]
MGVNPYLGEVMPFAGNFAIRGWAFCDGQLLSIAANTALFSILGTTYGGNGRTTFALQDLRGRSIIHPGSGPGLSTFRLGERGGAENHRMTIQQMASHNHTMTGAPTVAVKTTSEDGEDSVPNGNILAKPIPSTGKVDAYAGDTNTGAGALDGVTAKVGTLAAAYTGNQQAFSIRNPFLGINMEIALQGVFPSRS